MRRLSRGITAAALTIVFAGVAQADEGSLPNDPNVCSVKIDGEIVHIPNVHMRVMAIQERLNQELSIGLEVDGLCGENTEKALEEAFAQGLLTYNPNAPQSVSSSGPK